MAHYYEKIATETRDFYTTTLVKILTPLIYEGLLSMYIHAVECDNKMAANGGKNLGPLKTFQHNLEQITNLNDEKIFNELERIKSASKCSDIFEDLVRAVIKSNIVLLTYTGKKSEIVEAKHHENISITHFIHKCYIESGKVFYNLPKLFWHKYPSITIKDNQKEIHEIIKESIKEAIRQMLPMKLILGEYLKNDYVNEEEMININITKDEYEKIKYLLEESKKIEDIKNVTGNNFINFNHVYDKNINYHKKGSLIFETDDSSDYQDDNFFDNDANSLKIMKISENKAKQYKFQNPAIEHLVAQPELKSVTSNVVDDIIESQKKEIKMNRINNDKEKNNNRDKNHNNKDNGNDNKLHYDKIPKHNVK